MVEWTLYLLLTLSLILACLEGREGERDGGGRERRREGGGREEKAMVA